jgi:pimeloyl-ACP methyl ester carboxylesterase
MQAAAADAASLTLRSCHVAGVEEAVRCGELPVAENPARPQGRKIRLHVVLLQALVADSARVPLFDLAGGPGMAASEGARFFATDGRIHRQHRDVVLIDQRGTGSSHPLRCPEIESESPLSPMYPVDAVRRCRHVLERDADLSQYTTGNSATDLDAVRAALGYSKIDLSALSYGTRLAIVYMRLYPQHVRSAALIGTLADDAKIPLMHARNAQTVLNDIFEDCAGDSACRQAFPDLSQRWLSVLQTVDAGPVVKIVSNGHDMHIALTRGPFVEAFRQLLVTTSGQRRVPYLIDRMSRGDFEPFLAGVLHGANPFAEGLLLSVTCAEDMAWITATEREQAGAGTFLGTYRIDEQARACKEWKVPAVKLARQRVLDIPVLFFAGDRDYVTPVAWAKAVAADLPSSRILTIPKLGHFPDGLEHMDCFDAVMNDFFERGKVDNVDTACISDMTPLAFMLSEPAPKL